jgi:hypothetical protein
MGAEWVREESGEALPIDDGQGWVSYAAIVNGRL